MFRKLHDLSASGPALVPALTLTIDGQPVQAEAGDTVAAVLLRQDPLFSRTTPVSGSPRAPYCMMGVCFECLAVVDGVASTQTCLVQVREGMQVHRQHGRRVVSVITLDSDACDDADACVPASPASTARPAGEAS